MSNNIHSIWVGDFRSYEQFEHFSAKKFFSVFDWIDDRLLSSRHPFSFPAYCTVCDAITEMRLDWFFGATEESGSIHPAWTETVKCEECTLNSRMRALWDFIKVRVGFNSVKNAYISEQTTPFYRKMKVVIPSLIGSEYLNPNLRSGKLVRWRGFQFLRHEDLTNLSFEDGSFDLVITLDVFEHIPNYTQAFKEIYRVLTYPGYLVFTIPFFHNLRSTRIRATVGPNGITHLCTPEIHGNPVSQEGSLCFQNFGWDILQIIKMSGFSDAVASMYWGPWQGHLGYPFFVFWALKDVGRAEIRAGSENNI